MVIDASALLGPAVVAACVSGVITIIGMVVTTRTAKAMHSEKLRFDEELAREKFDFDTKMANRKFTFDKELAERKLQSDAHLADRKRHQDLAEEILTGFYELRDIMREVRSPAGYEGEGKSRKRQDHEPSDLSDRLDVYWTPLERLHRHRETVARLMSRQYRAVAWFGLDAAAPFRLMNEAIAQVATAANMMITTARARSGTTPPSWERWEAAIWWGGEDDEVSSKINEAVGAAEALCRPILSAKSAAPEIA